MKIMSTLNMTSSMITFLKHNDKHAPFKKLCKKELRLTCKAWITKGIHKSIKVKNQLYKKCVTIKDNFYHTRYKVMRDKINHLLQSEKKKYHNKFFENNKNNMKKIWFKINHHSQEKIKHKQYVFECRWSNHI